MNLLILTAEYPPFSVGGVALHVRDINERLVKGYQSRNISVVTFSHEENLQEVCIAEQNGIELISVPVPAIPESADYPERYRLQNEAVNRALYSLRARTNCYEIIILHGYFLANAAIYAKSLFNIPIIYHAHTLYSSSNDLLSDDNSIYLAEKRICYESSRIISVSNYLKDEIIKLFHIDPLKITIITKGVELSEFDSIRIGRKRFSEKRKVLLYVGRISFEKGIETLLESLSIIQKSSDIAFVCFIVGQATDVEYLQSVKDLILRLNLQKSVCLLGSKESSEIIALYKNSDISIVPSYAETFGKVAIESMAAKTPVIVADVGGLGPIIEDGVTGLKFKSGDAVELANRITYLCVNENVAESLAENGYREVCKRYTFQSIFDKTLHEYEGVIMK